MSKGILDLFSGISQSILRPPKTIGRTEVEGLVVSTVDTPDYGPENSNP